MTPDEHNALVELGRWHLDQAEQCDQRAREPYDPPPLPAGLLTEAWLHAAASPETLRRTADSHRREARRIHDLLAQPHHKE